MAAGQAKKGGQIGKNGEFYKGGQFLPNTQLPKRGAAKRVKGTGRVLIAPGVFDVPPEGKGAIYGRISIGVKFEGEKAVAVFAEDHPAIAYYFDSYAQYLELIERYNAGERFI
jgi:hypothetical protein